MWLILFIACSGSSVVDTGEVVADRGELGALRFSFPLPERERFPNVIGMDHDPEVHSDSVLGGARCVNYDGEPFPACYDEHDGTDYLLEGASRRWMPALPRLWRRLRAW